MLSVASVQFVKHAMHALLWQLSLSRRVPFQHSRRLSAGCVRLLLDKSSCFLLGALVHFYLPATDPHGSGASVLQAPCRSVILATVMTTLPKEYEGAIDPKLPWWGGDWSTWPEYNLRVELKADATKKEDLPQLGYRFAQRPCLHCFQSILMKYKPNSQTMLSQAL